MPKPCTTATVHDQAVGPVPDPPAPPPADPPADPWSDRLSAGHAAAFAVVDAAPAADAPTNPATRRRAGNTDQE